MDPYQHYNNCCYNYVNNSEPMSQSQQNTYNYSQIPLSRSIIYINQNFRGVETVPVASNKVLINPNFVASKVHINPNYIKTKGIFVNPNNVIWAPSTLAQKQVVANSPTRTSDVLVSTKNKWVRKSAVSNNTRSAVKYTKYKIVRKDTTPKRRRRSSLNLRFKLIRSNSNKSKVTEMANKFKVDRRNSAERRKSALYLLNKAYRLKIDHRNAILKQRSYKKVLNNSNGKRMSSRILNISGRKYKMDRNRMVLKLAMTASDGSKVSKRSVKVQKRRNGDLSSNKIAPGTKLRTNNIPCPTYHRFGICQRHKRGMCQKVHNPDQIALCSKFLQGLCHSDECPLSHKVSPSKMATCKFFLDGLCTKDDCPYPHVKVNSNVAICKEFLSGFCPLGKECDKRHELLCPYFEENGRCIKRNCQFPHARNVKRRQTSTDRSSVVKNPVIKYNKVLCASSNSSRKNRGGQEAVKDCSGVAADDGTANKRRYYQEDKISEMIIKSTNAVENVDFNDISLIKRPRLGNLPTFIPFQ